ncbi:hypothetical protein RIF29_21921 [Crotalaria pallida]|uniref:Uncharacterized protein n=1 Tax=Crotalaria pallida TaxID=3830 RepID=A0AAN9F8A0_CROPI
MSHTALSTCILFFLCTHNTKKQKLKSLICKNISPPNSFIPSTNPPHTLPSSLSFFFFFPLLLLLFLLSSFFLNSQIPTRQRNHTTQQNIIGKCKCKWKPPVTTPSLVFRSSCFSNLEINKQMWQ